MAAPVLRLHVANWERWQRFKMITVIVLLVAALFAAGGSEWDPSTEPSGDLGLCALLLCCIACLIWNIERNARRLRLLASRDV